MDVAAVDHQFRSHIHRRAHVCGHLKLGKIERTQILHIDLKHREATSPNTWPINFVVFHVVVQNNLSLVLVKDPS